MKSFSSSFNIGGQNGKFLTSTSTGSTYTLQNQMAASPNKDFEKQLRDNHFNISHAIKKDPNHYVSVTNNCFQ